MILQVIDPVIALCAAATDIGTDGGDVGGGAIDHFVDGHLESCTNVAQGQPATQSSVAWAGVGRRRGQSMGMGWMEPGIPRPGTSQNDDSLVENHGFILNGNDFAARIPIMLGRPGGRWI